MLKDVMMLLVHCSISHGGFEVARVSRWGVQRGKAPLRYSLSPKTGVSGG